MPGESRSHFILTSQNWPKTGDPATYLDIPFGRPGPSKLVVWSCTQELRPSLKTSMAEAGALSDKFAMFVSFAFVKYLYVCQDEDRWISQCLVRILADLYQILM